MTRLPLRARTLGTLLALVLGTCLPAGGLAAQFACAPTGEPPALTATPGAYAPEAAFPEEGGTLTVFAAASLVDAFAEIASRLEAAHPGLEVVVETAGSQTLVTRLQEGARADVLATASTSTMQAAEESGLLAGPPIPFTGNRLVIVAPPDNPAGITEVADLAGEDVRLVIASDAVPAGAYAEQALCAYAGSAGAPSAFLEHVWRNVVSEEEDVRSVLAKVQLGEADAGIVYASDAAAAQRAGTTLTVVAFPAGVPTTAVYPIAPVAGGDVELATAFIGHVVGAEGQLVLTEYGFSPAS